MKNLRFILIVLIVNGGCTTTKHLSPVADNREAAFTIAPYILKKNGSFYLVYQVDTKEGTNVRWVIGERNTKDKLYFFFAGKTSFPEYHHVVLRPVTKNENNIARCKADAVFWLNPDGSEMKLKIVGE